MPLTKQIGFIAAGHATSKVDGPGAGVAVGELGRDTLEKGGHCSTVLVFFSVF